MARKPTTNFKRSKKKQPERAKILIVCEDEKFSVSYFKDLCRDLRINSIVEVTGESGSAPQSVLEYALELAIKEKDSEDAGFRTVYCVIDRDEHPTYERMVQDFDKDVKKKLNAKLKNVNNHPEFKLITSIRCFEIWILLHLSYSSKAFSAQDSLLSEIKKKLAS